MAQLPDQLHSITQIDGRVVLYELGSEEQIVNFDPTDRDATARAQKTIHDTDRLDPEAKCFAHFWSGYFYAHAN